MNNIKTVEVIKALAGLEVGDTLTRQDGNSNFELKVETITDSYSATRHISISQSLLNKSEFKAVEWFEQKMTNKEKIAHLEKQNEDLKNQLDTLNKRIEAKRVEFESKSAKLVKDINKGVIYNQSFEDLDEALTVYHNLIDLLKKLKA